MSDTDTINNQVWHFYMQAAEAPKTGKTFYVQSFPIQNLNSVFDRAKAAQERIHSDICSGKTCVKECLNLGFLINADARVNPEGTRTDE